jgi:putative selenium metabolism protein SsnA
MNAIIHVRIYDFHTYIEDGYVIFEQTIVKVGHMTDFSGRYKTIIDGKGKLLMPGLINGHNHIYSTFARGMSVPFHPTSFQELLEQLWWKLDRNLTNAMTYSSALVAGIENIKHGVTTIIDHHASGEIIGSLEAIQKGLSKVGIRNILCFETSDRFPIDDCITENKRYIHQNDSTTTGLVGLHASFTLSNQTLQRIKLEFPKSPIHIHVAESKDDQTHSVMHHHMRVVERLDHFRLIQPGSILVHGLYLSDNELNIIKKRGAVVALNVTSNMNNGVGLPNYQALKQYQIPVIIGNDGINQEIASEYQALYYTMHHQANSATGFTFDDLKDVIENTYQYASRQLGVSLGRMDQGYQADFLLLDYQEPTPLNKDTIFGHLFFGLFHDFQPTDVFIGGNHILSNHEFSFDIQPIYQEATAQANKLWQSIEKEGKTS